MTGFDQVRSVAYVIYNGMTSLDFVGIYDPLARIRRSELISGFRWDICALTDEVVDHDGLRLLPTRVGAPLEGYDLLVVPGGFATRTLVHDAAFIAWLRSAASCRLKVSVCTGSLLLGAAGFLEGKRATTHHSAFDDLRPYCREVLDQRIVDESDVITAGGVTSSLDLGLYLCERLVGREAAERIRASMEYRSTDYLRITQ